MYYKLPSLILWEKHLHFLRPVFFFWQVLSRFRCFPHTYILCNFYQSPLLNITPLPENAFNIYNMIHFVCFSISLQFILVLLLTGFPCKLCPPGSFNNEIRAQTCECCPDGYSSTYMKTSCRPCPANEWAKHETFPNCSLCQTCFTLEDCEYFCLRWLETVSST